MRSHCPITIWKCEIYRPASGGQRKTMGQSPSIEEIMQRIRVEVGRRNAGATQRSEAALVTTGRNLRQAGDSAQSAGGPQFELEINDLTPLRGEIDTALEGTRQVGQINPRNPGLHNDAIQFAKKVMRRSLTWYTRPLHYFQGGAIRALQRITGVLQSHERSLQKISQELTRHVGLIDESAKDLATEKSRRAREVAELNEKTAALEMSVSEQAMKTAALDVSSVEQANATQALQGKTASLHRQALELEQRLTRVTDEFQAKLAKIAAANAEIEAAHEEKFNQSLLPFSQRIASFTNEIDSLRSELCAARNELREIKSQSRVRERDLRRFFHDFQRGTVVSSEDQNPAPVPPMFPSGIKHESEFDYFAFEDRYRGDEEGIRSRQNEYVGYFRGRENVVDIGCGRGEFLELLRDNHIRAKGVERGTDQYLLCLEKGLDVVQQDLFLYLESLPDESIGGLFSAQVIEHLSASDQLRFVALAYHKTAPGSPVVFETINAQCVWAVMRNFFLDPTHVRPVHPETLKFAMESVNFKNVELRFSSPMSDRLIPPLTLSGDPEQLATFNRAIQDLNEIMYGNQDYAAIGWR